MEPAMNRDRFQFESLVKVADEVSYLTRQIDKLDFTLIQKGEKRPEVLRQEINANIASFEKIEEVLAKFTRRCHRNGFEGVAAAGEELLFLLKDVQKDLKANDVALAKGGKQLDYYKGENLAMSLSRFKEGVEAFKLEGEREEFKQKPVTLSDFVLPAAITVGSVLLTREVLRLMLDKRE